MANLKIKMRIAIFGLGYIGCVTAACFARLGHFVIGVDIRTDKVNNLQKGITPIKEKRLNELISLGIGEKRLFFITDAEKAVMDSEIAFICVGTPSKVDGSIDLSAIKRICLDLSRIITNKKKKGYVIVIRSSIIPGTIEMLKKEIKNKFGLVENKDFHFAENPEFLREGSAVKDFFNPPNIVIGCNNKNVSKKVAKLYERINAPVFLTSIKEAEIIKYVNNSFHALKVAFTNEIASICRELRIDSRKVMEIFCNDHLLNISEYYFKPGFAYGGSCLPKDLAALNYKAKELRLDLPLLKSISGTNKAHIRKAVEIIKKEAKKNSTKEIGIFGLAFKSGTDDIRGSPTVYLISKLLAKGYELKLYDPIIKKEQLENILSSYRDVIYDPVSETKNLKIVLPKISRLIVQFPEILNSKIIVVINKGPELEQLIKNLKKNQILIDLKGMINPKSIKSKYVRFC